MTAKAQLQSAGDGTAIPAGSVGEVKSVIQSGAIAISTGTNYTNVGSVLVPKGVWKVSAKIFGGSTSPATFNEAIIIGYSTDSTSGFSDFDVSVARLNTIVLTVPGPVNSSISNPRLGAGGDFGFINISSDTTYYMKIGNRVSSGSLDIAGACLYFLRIA